MVMQNPAQKQAIIVNHTAGSLIATPKATIALNTYLTVIIQSTKDAILTELRKQTTPLKGDALKGNSGTAMKTKKMRVVLCASMSYTARPWTAKNNILF